MVVSSMQHHTHHQQQGPVPPHLQHSRPSSVVHQHHSQAPAQQQQQQPQHSSAYSYPQQNQASNSQDHGLPYYAHPSPYSTPGATSGYTSAGEFFFSLDLWDLALLEFAIPNQPKLTRVRRHRRHDGCHHAETLSTNLVSHPAVELAGFGCVPVGPRSTEGHVRAASVAITPAVDVLWRAPATVLVDSGAGRPVAVRTARSTIPSVYGLAAGHDDVAHASPASHQPACAAALAVGHDG